MSEWTKNDTIHPKRWIFILLLFQFWCIRRASSTEIRVNTWYKARILSLDLYIDLPITMECHSLSPGYQEVLWYLDDALLAKKRGTNQLDLLRIIWKVSEDLSSALKYQGYYRCVTDNMGDTEATKYLFKIPALHTFVGKFVATRDTLEGKSTSGDELSSRRASYEKEIQEVLFSFLPIPNTYVNNITVLETGMEVRFYLYIVQRMWQPIYSDQLALEQAVAGLNRSDERMKVWMERKGIEHITLRSTMGCYKYVYMVPADVPHDIASGNGLTSRKDCTAKNGPSVTPVCHGDIYSGFRWVDPSGRCDILPSKFNFGGDPRPIYAARLRRMIQESKMPTVTDLNILTELTETYDFSLKEMGAALSVINYLFTVDKSKLEEAKSTYNLTSMLLRIIDNILWKTYQRDDKVVFDGRHLSLDVQRINNEKGMDFVLKANNVTYLLLHPDLPTHTEYFSQTLFFEDWLLFPNPKEVLGRRQKSLVLPSPVVYMRVDGGTAWNSIHPLRIYLRNLYGDSIENPVCVHFDRGMKDGEGGWSTEGCEYDGIKDGFFSCICHNHSIFSIVLCPKPGFRIRDVKIPDFKIPDFKMTELRNAGSQKVQQNSFSGLNLFWIIPLGILMVIFRIVIIRWCRSLWSIERSARPRDVAFFT